MNSASTTLSPYLTSQQAPPPSPPPSKPLALNVTSTTATSTFANGINLTNGCFAIGGSCILNSGLVAGDLDSQKNITLQALRTASSTEQATTTILIDGIADSFSNTSGIDTTNSININTATAGQISSTGLQLQPAEPSPHPAETGYTLSLLLEHLHQLVAEMFSILLWLEVVPAVTDIAGSGGGAGGGFRTSSSFAVTGQAYTVTVGAGGCSKSANIRKPRFRFRI